ncbi:MAG: hypothetical protein IPG88_09630 [Gemmatimonadetes bacterium]|nr:hypothetical protein [Gemmatimonadota bacterium]
MRAFTASRDGTAREWVYNPWVRGASIFDFDSTAAAVDPGENALSAVRFSHDGRLLAIATSGGRIAVAPVEALNAPRLLSTTSSTTRALVFSQDDRRLIALAVDGGRTEWALDAQGGPRDTVRIESSREIMILDATVSADGRHAFGFSTPGSFVDADAPDAAPDAAVDSGLFVWHLERREPPVKVTSPDGTIIVAAVSGNGQLLATGTGRGTVHVQGVDGTGARTGIVVPDADDPYPLLPTSAAFSHDGLQLAVGWEDGAVTMHPVSGRSAGRRLAGHTQPVTAVEFADDGKRLLSVSRDGTIRIWDVRAGRSVVTLRPRGIGAPPRTSPRTACECSPCRSPTPRRACGTPMARAGSPPSPALAPRSPAPASAPTVDGWSTPSTRAERGSFRWTRRESCGPSPSAPSASAPTTANAT